MEITPFAEFAIIILLAASLGFLSVKLRQPPVLGYIFTGLIIGPLTPFFVPHSESVELLAKVGVTFLLFTLGLELKVSDLRKLGKVALATGLGQLFFTSIVGFLISLLLGFDSITSIYISIALTFSSTIVIVKLLTTKNQLDTLFGKISVGFLLVQDFVAILILIGLSTVEHIHAGSITELVTSLGITMLKGVIAGFVVYFFVKYILYPILNSLRLEKEVLFLLTIAWALICAAIMGSEFVGFTIEVGGLVAGIALSNRFEQLQIESWTRPLRDFFLALFFVLIGSQIQLDTVNAALIPAIIFSIFVLIGNPLIVMIIMGVLGYKKKTGFLTSLAVAQISEFSLLVVSFAYQELHQIDSLALTVVTLVGGITMTVSSYMIYYNEQLYDKLAKYLDIFEFRHDLEEEMSLEEKLDKTVVMFGCKRTGRNLLKIIQLPKKEILIVDYDPQIVRNMRSEGYDALYADMSDEEMYKYFNLEKAEVVISTVPALHENAKLLRIIKELHNKPVTVITANDGPSSAKLYELGADFVVYPHLLSGEVISKVLKKKKLPKVLIKRRSKNMEHLASLT